VSAPDGYWDERTKNRWFFGYLAFSTGALLVLFSPYLYVLMFAVVLVVVTWPVFTRIRDRVGGRRALAAILTLLLLAVVVFAPLATLIYVFVLQALEFVQNAIAWVTSPELGGWLTTLQSVHVPEIEERLGTLLGQDVDLVKAVTGPLQSGALAVLQAAGTFLPGLVNTTVNASIDVVIFLFAAVSLYMEGPRVLRVAKNLSPMDDAYEDQLFSVFRQFANNMVIGSLATSALQGLVAGIGYAIAGVPQVVFLGILTGVGAFIPLVGTALVWVPVTIYVAATEGIGWAVFVALWSMVVTASVDNVVKPLILRGGTNIHPLLIFLGVFGGLSWMGVPGVLVGPVVVAFFLALYTIYARDFLGQEAIESEAVDISSTSLFRRVTTTLPGLRRVWGTKPPEGAEADSEDLTDTLQTVVAVDPEAIPKAEADSEDLIDTLQTVVDPAAIPKTEKEEGKE